VGAASPSRTIEARAGRPYGVSRGTALRQTRRRELLTTVPGSLILIFTHILPLLGWRCHNRVMAVKDFGDWAEQQFGQAELGDRRRTHRAVRLGAALAAEPAASLPRQTGDWTALKAAYRLLSEPDVTHGALTAAHRQAVRRRAAARGGVVVFLQDTTELDYSAHPQTQGLGHIGDAKGRGLLVHSCLAVAVGEGEPRLLGLAAQTPWTRPALTPEKETRAQRARRRTEGDIWAETVEQIGRAPGGACTFVSVGDRASDIFTYAQRCQALGWHALARVCQNRVVEWGDDRRRERLFPVLRALEAQASKSLTLRGRGGEGARAVSLRIAWHEARVCAPFAHADPEARVTGWYVRCWEASDRPDALEWILFTTVPVTDGAACRVLDWYATRWLIEEYHKCLKTGCAVERRQLRAAGRLAALLGFVSLVAVRLLELRQEPEHRAVECLPPAWVALLAARRGVPEGEALSLSVRAFWHHLAGLGGFLGRKSDGEPGWQTLWRGWIRFQDMVWAASWNGSGP
jgi:hypothetical protein